MFLRLLIWQTKKEMKVLLKLDKNETKKPEALQNILWPNYYGGIFSKKSWFLVKKMYVIQKKQNILENSRMIDMRGYILGYFKNNFSETKTVTFMQKVIYLRCLRSTILLLTADGQEKIKFDPTIFYRKFYAGKLSIKF